MHILITGTASGLGRGFLVHYTRLCFLQDPASIIYAVDIQNPIYQLEDELTEVNLLNEEFQAIWSWAQHHINAFAVDITKEKSMKKFDEMINAIPLDLVIHSAGIRGLINGGTDVKSYKDVRKAENLESMDGDTMRRTFDVNAVGTFELLRRCTLGLKLAAAAFKTGPMNACRYEKPRVIVMGSRMGSIEHNQPANENAGAAYAYRASKAATNAIVRSFSVDVPEVIWTVVHPGRVETGLVGIKEDHAMPVMKSVSVIAELVETLNDKDNGRFMDRFGKDIPF
jgi:NAD(P)-dependent dehydrogenase (short-subunit alcohol dehydrogenase family)